MRKIPIHGVVATLSQLDASLRRWIRKEPSLAGEESATILTQAQQKEGFAKDCA
jgi:hypothetical protein